ncbi:MAG: hypothetical protein JXR63_13110 [Spirochaetales bacterium]|nr:hypothetical protein [Spirochaetales bacterium]
MRVKLTKRLFVLAVSVVFFGCMSESQFAEKYDKTANQVGFPELTNSDSWTMVILPETKNYLKFKKNQEVLKTMADWVNENHERLNIGLVLSVGDIVSDEDKDHTLSMSVDQTIEQQWEAFVSIYSTFWYSVPFIPAVGDSDMGKVNGSKRRSLLNQYYNVTTSDLINPEKGGILKTMWADPINGKTLQNALYEYESKNGKKFLIMAAEFGPRPKLMDWAVAELSMNDYREHSGVLLTHSYMGAYAARLHRTEKSWNKYNYFDDSLTGHDLWYKFVDRIGCFNFVFSGHSSQSMQRNSHIGFRVDRDMTGRTVNQMLFSNPRQSGFSQNGGDGWLRILEFLPDNKTVLVKTYSPYLQMWKTSYLDDYTMRY